MVTVLSQWYFAPTPAARQQLLRENVAARTIFVTGNAVIDALLYASRRQKKHWRTLRKRHGLREKLIKVVAKVVRHARQVIFQMAEVAVPRELFRAILERIDRLRLPTRLAG